MRPVGVLDQRADALDQLGALEQLQRERSQAAVLGRHREQPRAGMARDHAGQKPEIIVDGNREDGLRGDVDHAGARLAEEEQEEQEALLVTLHLGALAVELEALRGDDDDCLLVLIELPDRPPQRHELALQPIEPTRRLGLGKSELRHRQILFSQHRPRTHPSLALLALDRQNRPKCQITP